MKGNPSRLDAIDDIPDSESMAVTVIREQVESTAPPSLKVKRVDHYYSRWSKAWKYRVSIQNNSLALHLFYFA